MHVLLDQQNRRAVFLELLQCRQELIDDDGRDPGFVDDEDLRIRHQPARDRNHLLARERAGALALFSKRGNSLNVARAAGHGCARRAAKTPSSRFSATLIINNCRPSGTSASARCAGVARHPRDVGARRASPVRPRAY